MHPYNFEKIKLKIYYILLLDNNINHFYKIINDNYIIILFISKICALFIILSTILGKYQNEIQIKEIEEIKGNQNSNGYSIHKDIYFHTIEKYIFLKNIYVNCISIQKIKRNVYYLKYYDYERIAYNYNKSISFIANDY
ncbi:hypothetical protein DJ52_09100 [Brachyspira murdochii]|uniref:Uncharacterized protein n=1 Tax=Brachyspira murdochii TaxID=84378 RepID=A0ABX5B381_9SPIR|nr:hypothetical protein DJ52_09100 [Brachyspira murdochii]